MNFSNVASDKPSMFIASRLTNKVKAFNFFAAHAGLVQYKVCTPFSSWISVAPPHTGHTFGIAMELLFVRFSAICGMIILALYTRILSPIPSFKERITLMLCTDARLTVVPSSSTGSKTATGLISPVLLGLHSIFSSPVSWVSSAHLNAIAFLGNFAVKPREVP